MDLQREIFLQTLCQHVNGNRKFISITNWRSLKKNQKTWNLLRTLFPSNTFSCTPSFLTVNNETFTNPTAIAIQLNHHFFNIGKSL